MLKGVFLGIVIIHGLIHLLGFIKAYNMASVNQLSQPISKTAGILWLLVTVLFLTIAVLFFLKNDYWMAFGIITVVLSQILIIMTWKDAKFGTIPNIIIFLVLVLSMGSYFFEQSYRKDVAYNFTYNNDHKEEILTDNNDHKEEILADNNDHKEEILTDNNNHKEEILTDNNDHKEEILTDNNDHKEEILADKNIEHLPIPVQKYLNYVGVVGKPHTKNFYAVFEGKMKDRQKEFFFTSEQYNFFKEPSRLFFMKGKMFGINVPGYHRYMKQEASMDVKLFGLLPVVKEKSDIMFKSETVTTFSELCFYAPSLLAGENIVWEEIDSLAAKASFTNKNVTITATLYFNTEGQLVNFVSDDRYDISDMKQYRFSTPVSDYRNIEGYNVPTYAELVWHYPDGDFVYGKIRLKSIAYNLQSLH